MMAVIGVNVRIFKLIKENTFFTTAIFLSLSKHVGYRLEKNSLEGVLAIRYKLEHTLSSFATLCLMGSLSNCMPWTDSVKCSSA